MKTRLLWTLRPASICGWCCPVQNFKWWLDSKRSPWCQKGHPLPRHHMYGIAWTTTYWILLILPLSAPQQWRRGPCNKQSTIDRPCIIMIVLIVGLERDQLYISPLCPTQSLLLYYSKMVIISFSAKWPYSLWVQKSLSLHITANVIIIFTIATWPLSLWLLNEHLLYDYKYA
jgi:hypothetical protein